MAGWLGRAIGSLLGMRDVDLTTEINFESFYESERRSNITDFLDHLESREYTKLLDDVMLNRVSDANKEKALARIGEIRSEAIRRGYK